MKTWDEKVKMIHEVFNDKAMQCWDDRQISFKLGLSYGFVKDQRKIYDARCFRFLLNS